MVYSGEIGALGLSDFWDSLTDSEQQLIKKYRASALSTGSADTLLTGSVWTSQTPARFLEGYASWAISEKQYDLAEKLLLKAVSYRDDPVDTHFVYNHLIELYYKQRDTKEYALQKAKEYCRMDIELFPTYVNPLIDRVYVLPRCPSFQQLAIIYEKEGDYESAIQICELAIKYHLKDTTKGGFKARLSKLQGKLEKIATSK